MMMMMIKRTFTKKFFVLFVSSLLSITFFSANAQEDNPQGKKIWAKSFINNKAPELVVENWITDEPQTNGKFIIIDFWATWCPPCRKAIPILNKFAQEFKDDIVVIGLSNETPEKIKQMVDPKIEYYIASDTQKRMMRAVEVKGIPHVIVIDPKGVVRWEGAPNLTDYELTFDILKDLIKKY